MTGLALGLASLGPCRRCIQGKSSRFGPSLLMGLEIAMKSNPRKCSIIMDNQAAPKVVAFRLMTPLLPPALMRLTHSLSLDRGPHH
jgi:hypothetical protein